MTGYLRNAWCPACKRVTEQRSYVLQERAPMEFGGARCQVEVRSGYVCGCGREVLG